jgi:hypothetical protein
VQAGVPVGSTVAVVESAGVTVAGVGAFGAAVGTSGSGVGRGVGLGVALGVGVGATVDVAEGVAGIAVEVIARPVDVGVIPGEGVADAGPSSARGAQTVLTRNTTAPSATPASARRTTICPRLR